MFWNGSLRKSHCADTLTPKLLLYQHNHRELHGNLGFRITNDTFFKTKPCKYAFFNIQIRLWVFDKVNPGNRVFDKVLQETKCRSITSTFSIVSSQAKYRYVKSTATENTSLFCCICLQCSLHHHGVQNRNESEEPNTFFFVHTDVD